MIIFLDYYLGIFSDLYTIQLWFVYPDYTYVKSSVTVIKYSTKHLLLGPRSICVAFVLIKFLLQRLNYYWQHYKHPNVYSWSLLQHSLGLFVFVRAVLFTVAQMLCTSRHCANYIFTWVIRCVFTLNQMLFPDTRLCFDYKLMLIHK